MNRQRALVLLLALAGLGAVGCTGPGSHAPVDPSARATVAPAPARLDAFRSCDDALSSLRRATSASVTAYGLPGSALGGVSAGPMREEAGVASAAGTGNAPDAATAPGAAVPAASAAGSSASSSAPAYSATNTAEPGVDEPDLVKTDGRRIVTVEGSQLTVVDASSKAVTGKLQLPGSAGIRPYPMGPAFAPSYGTANLLLSGDHALVLEQGWGSVGPIQRSGQAYPAPSGLTRLLLVDLAGQPRVISSYSISGGLLDARMVGSVVRVVTQTAPRLILPAMEEGASQPRMLAANRAAVARAGVGTWLPSYSTTSGGRTVSGSVPCTSVSRPSRYSGTSLLTVETFDLSSAALGTGTPVSVEADGDTVYGTASSLYIASGNQWAGQLPSGIRQQTEIYRFDISQAGPPRFAASGVVPGYLVDQYALSEWNGYLRVATTTGLSWAAADGPSPAGASAAASSSAVYELSLAGPGMPIVGKVTGLGSGERIYSVRFMGPVGYVVTFRQTDPLYTVDLSDPASPRVVGSLALTGYSAYLHPASATELIGIGQSADKMGHVGGMQVSLFDVRNLASPARLATYALAGASSVAEFDPHAFLYWPGAGLVVVPLDAPGQSGDLVLRLSGGGLTRAGLLQVPTMAPGTIQRSLVIGGTLWTVASSGLMASDLRTLHDEAWLSFS
jgi:beta propeller domain-containing protein